MCVSPRLTLPCLPRFCLELLVLDLTRRNAALCYETRPLVIRVTVSFDTCISRLFIVHGGTFGILSGGAWRYNGKHRTSNILSHLGRSCGGELLAGASTFLS